MSWWVSGLAIFGVVVASGCGAGTVVRGGGKVGELSVREVIWNPGEVDVGRVSAVAGVGERVVVFGSHGAVTLERGVVVGTDGKVLEWSRGEAGVIPAAEGGGEWVVGVAAGGGFFRVKDDGRIVEAGERYGLRRGVRSFGVAGEGRVAFVLRPGLPPGMLVVFDGQAASVYSELLFGAFAAGGGRLAWSKGQGVEVRDVKTWNEERLPLEGTAAALAIDGRGRLHMAVESEIRAWDADGRFVVRYEATGKPRGPFQMVSSGDRVWFLDGEDLGVIEGESTAVTTQLGIPEGSVLEGSGSGDVWVIDRNGSLGRYAVERWVGAGR